MDSSGAVAAASALAVTLGAVLALVVQVQRLRAATRDLEVRSRHTNRATQDLARSIATLSRQTDAQSDSEVVRAQLTAELVARALLDSGSLGGRTSDSELILREISHGLNTPLQQIDVTLRRVRPLADMSPDSTYWSSLENASKGVDLCRAIIVAYRELVSLTQSIGSAGGGIANLATSLEAAFAIFIERSGSATVDRPWKATVSIPASIRGYSNHFLIALAVPLIQNAVEASPPGARLTLRGVDSVDECSIEVSNFSRNRPDLEAMRADGFTSKGDNHQGLGLSSVRTLISRTKGASLEFYLDGDARVVARLSLPPRKDLTP